MINITEYVLSVVHLIELTILRKRIISAFMKCMMTLTVIQNMESMGIIMKNMMIPRCTRMYMLQQAR